MERNGTGRFRAQQSATNSFDGSVSAGGCGIGKGRAFGEFPFPIRWVFSSFYRRRDSDLNLRSPSLFNSSDRDLSSYIRRSGEWLRLEL